MAYNLIHYILKRKHCIVIRQKKSLKTNILYSLLLLLRKDLNYEIRQLQICWIISVTEQAGNTRPGTTGFSFLFFIANLSQPDRGVICDN